MNWAALTKSKNPVNGGAIAEVLRRMAARDWSSLNPWLAFPQNACSFWFGRPPRPLPIGALRILWDEGIPFSQPCPECGHTLRMISFGGLLSVGGGRLICPGCDGDFFQSMGSLSTVSQIVGATRLRGTEFAPSSTVFGGSVGSDGEALLAELGLRPIHEPEDGVVRADDGQRTRLGFKVGPKPKTAKRTADDDLSKTQRVVLSAYLDRASSEKGLAEAIDRLELSGSAIDGDGYPSLLDAAVAEVLLQAIRDTLPQWALIDEQGVTLGRKKVTRSKRKTFQPKHLFTINWADSVPGFSSPEAYYATPVPMYGLVVITASADGEDLYGFTDFAIGHFDGAGTLLDGVRQVVTDHWSRRAEDGQTRWQYLFKEGVVTEAMASSWADEVAWQPDLL